MFGFDRYKIKKYEIFFGDVVRYTTDFDGPIEDIVAKGDKGMYVTDLEHTLLIKNKDTFINLTCVNNKKIYSKINQDDKPTGTLYKCNGN